MTAFWIVAGLLTAGALLFVVPPLLAPRVRTAAPATHDAANVSIYRDQLRELDADLEAGTITADQYATAKLEIEKRVLEEVESEQAATTRPAGSKVAAIGVVALVPVAAIALYVALGNPAGLDPQQAAAQEEQAHSLTPEQIAGMVQQLAERMQREPDNVEGWVMLARSYNAMQRFAEAAAAYKEAAARTPANAQLLADYADTLAMAQGRNLLGEPEGIIQQALVADPNNIKALALAGTVAFNKGEFVQAATHWEKILGLVPPESDFARAMQGSVAEARTKAGLPPATAAAPAAAPAAAASASAHVHGRVSLAADLAAKARPEDTVFVFARAAEGPRMPLAIVRKQVKDLPFEFELDDSMAMSPAARLSSFPKVVIGARVSKAGSATPQPGDLEGLSAPVAVGTTGLAITIDSEVK